MIRWAETKDIDALYAMACDMAKDSTFSTLTIDEERFKSHCDAIISHGFAMVAERDGEIIGGMLADAVRPWYSMDFIGIDYGIYIKPDKRNGLIAAKLVKLFESWCMEQDVKQIRPGTSTGHDGISRLYEFLGYKRSGDLFVKEV